MNFLLLTLRGNLSAVGRFARILLLLLFVPSPVFGAPLFNDASYRQLANEIPDSIRHVLLPLPQLVNPQGPAPSDTFLSRERAAYLPESDSLLIYGKPGRLTDDLRQTIFHEWGHAYAVRAIAPRALCDWAAKETPWREVALDCASATSLRSPVLLQPHPLYSAPAFLLEERADVPGRYALSGIHEYFAETFASWLMACSKGAQESGLAPDKLAMQRRQLAQLGVGTTE